MAPWTTKQISTSLEKLTLANRDEVARKLANLVETRSQVEKLAKLVSAKVIKLYTPGFHRSYDDGRRALADAFVAKLVYHLANRSKPIKGVSPAATSTTPRIIPLFKADLLASAWKQTRSRGKLHQLTMGPVLVTLYGAGVASVTDAQRAMRDCLEGGDQDGDWARVDDAMLILEHVARDMDGEAPAELDRIMSKLTRRLEGNAHGNSEERAQCGDRIMPSLYDRLDVLIDHRRRAWKIGPYGAVGYSGAQSSNSDPAASRRGSRAPIALTDNESDSDDEEIATPHGDGQESLTSAVGVDDEEEEDDDYSDEEEEDTSAIPRKGGQQATRKSDVQHERRNDTVKPASIEHLAVNKPLLRSLWPSRAQSREELVIWTSSS